MAKHQWAEAEIQQAVQLRKFVRKVGADLGQLDMLVEDAKCREAISINNKGLWAQICYLLKKNKMDSILVREAVMGELTALQRSGLVSQHKYGCGPAVSVNKKKRRSHEDHP